MKCLVTGCGLIDQDHNRHVWGDLHEVGNTFVFVACVGEEGLPAWQYDSVPSYHSSPCVRIEGGADVFSRAHVLAFEKDDARLNHFAQARAGL